MCCLGMAYRRTSTAFVAKSSVSMVQCIILQLCISAHSSAEESVIRNQNDKVEAD